MSKFLILFGLFWSALTLLFDGLILSTLARQLLATRFAVTQGRMIASEVTRHHGKGTTYGVRMQYTYLVQGRELEGDRFRYDSTSSSDSKWAYQAVREHPPGAKIAVHYDPRQPADSVLQPGLAGSDLFMLAFMTPFNAVMFGLWWSGWSRLRRAWFKKPTSGLKITNHLRQTRVRLTEISPLAAAIMALALLAFASIFVVALVGRNGFHPSLETMMITWGTILAGSLVAGGWQWRRSLSGHYDLILDQLHGTLELPALCGRKERRKVAYASVQAVRLDVVTKNVSSKGQASVVYVPTLELAGETGSSAERLAEWHQQQQAEALVAWLRSQLPATRNS